MAHWNRYIFSGNYFQKRPLDVRASLLVFICEVVKSRFITLFLSKRGERSEGLYIIVWLYKDSSKKCLWRLIINYWEWLLFYNFQISRQMFIDDGVYGLIGIVFFLTFSIFLDTWHAYLFVINLCNLSTIMANDLYIVTRQLLYMYIVHCNVPFYHNNNHFNLCAMQYNLL